MFIAVGPPSFTALALIGMAQDVAVTGIFTSYATLAGITNQAMMPDILSLLALLAAVFLWMLAFVRLPQHYFCPRSIFPRLCS
jgi:hypothetical protein